MTDNLDSNIGIYDVARIERTNNVVVNIERMTLVEYANTHDTYVDHYFLRSDVDDLSWIGLRYLGPEEGFEQPPLLSVPSDYEDATEVIVFRNATVTPSS
jgi:hypothetical protein